MSVVRFLLRATWRSALFTAFILFLGGWLSSASAHFAVSDKVTRLTLYLVIVPTLTFLVLRWRTQSSVSRLVAATAFIASPVVVSVLFSLRSEASNRFVPIAACPEGQQLSGAAFPAGTEIGCLDHSGRKQGRWAFWHSSGSKLLTAGYLDGRPDGDFVWWHENGQKFQEGAYKGGRQYGSWSTWTREGQVQWEGTYDETGVLTSGIANYPVALP